MFDWRPREGGEIALTDDHLKRIGYAVVAEGHSKAIACSMLRAVEQLSHEEWIRLDRQPLKAICQRLLNSSAGVDAELTARLQAFDAARENAHELRHIVVHVTWCDDGQGQPTGFDYGRQRHVSIGDVEAAMSGCAELKRAANWAAMRVAELIENGVWSERPDGQGMNIRTANRLVRL
jgi:hypothetical protein